MKYSTKVFFSFVLLAIMFFANSCSFEINKRRYSRGWNIGFSKEYVTVDTRKKTKSNIEKDSLQGIRNQDFQAYAFGNEQFFDTIIHQDSTDHELSSNSSNNEIQKDTNEIIITQPDEITVEESTVTKEDEALKKERIWYTLAIVFLSIFGLSLFIFLPYWAIYLIFGGNAKTFLLITIVMFVGFLINIFTLIKAGLVLMKETDYWTYNSNYNTLTLLSSIFLGFVLGIIFLLLFKRNKSEFKNVGSQKPVSLGSKILKTLVSIFLIFVLLLFLSSC